MKSHFRIAGEGIFVGLVLILFVYVAGFLLKLLKYPDVSLPEVCEKWNQTYIMEANLLLAGFLFHVVFEYSGINKWYSLDYVKNL